MDLEYFILHDSSQVPDKIYSKLGVLQVINGIYRLVSPVNIKTLK